MASEAPLQNWLESFISEHGGVAGTVHTRTGDLLLLRAAVNIPAKVAEVTARIPKGKGMAGLAWERDRCVATCDLQTDESGDVRPGARAVDAQAALAIPVRGGDGAICAVVGIAFADERTFDDAALTEFVRAAAELPADPTS